MSENTEKKIGTKRIMDVPIIEELGENSYVLVDNDGAAARIPGSKVGGGGEVPMLLGELLYYAETTSSAGSPFYKVTYEDGSPIDYATAKPILLQRPMLIDYIEGHDSGYLMFGYIDFYDEQLTADIATTTASNLFNLHFSDTPEDPWAEE